MSGGGAPGGLLIGTVDGLHRPGGGGAFAGRRVTALAPRPQGRGWLALLDGSELWAGDGDGEGDGWEQVAELGLDGRSATCVAAVDGGALVGTSEAHLLRVTAGGAVEPVAGFEAAPDRDRWYTPWGGPPDTRSIAVAPAGDAYVGVHVGGILRAADAAGTAWAPTIDIDSDIHQVVAGPGGELLVACALGFAVSRDRGRSWDYVTSGLHGAYSRAVAVAGEWLLLSASSGPSTSRAAVYRRPLAATATAEPFHRCTDGLPEWFGANVDTGQLVASGSAVALGTAEGTVYTSADAGATWTMAASGLPAVTALGLPSSEEGSS